MIRMGDITILCHLVEVQDDDIAQPLFGRLLGGDFTDQLWAQYLSARKSVWRVETARRGLSLFRPVLWLDGYGGDFDTEREARAFAAELEAGSLPASSVERLRTWIHELKRSVRECGDWLRWRIGRFWASRFGRESCEAGER